tara:strand:+ start:847 stop:1926 length:1080 start_codon:yes stop_codon:yes gene_type:complete
MAIATMTQYWSSRMNGGNPTSLSGSFNADFTLTGNTGAASGDYWVIDNNAQYSIVPTATENDYTMVASFTFSDTGDIPSAGTTLMSLDNGSYHVEVQSKGNASKLDLVGSSTATTHDLDLDENEEFAVPIVLRLTLSATGKANLYMRELIEDDNGTQHYLSVNGSSSVSKKVIWGNTTGTVKWGSVYFSKFGAFSPTELMTSGFAQDVLARMGLSIVENLKNSKRLYLKTQVSDSSIMYGYDLSSDMLNRINPPTIHVLMEGLRSPGFESLGGAKVRQEYDAMIFVTTRGTQYESAYRDCLNIAGEVFDELYTTTGLQGTTDSIISYEAELDIKLDAGDTVCTHRLRMTYERLIDMRHR